MSKKVEVIKPNSLSKDEKRKKRVAAYARVSTGSDEQAESFKTQVNYYKSFIKNNPDWEFVGVFADQAISGTTDERPEFQRMINMALNNKIDVIYTKSISRFSRSLRDLLRYVEDLKNAGVNVIFEDNNIDLLSENGSLLISIIGSVAQMEVENTSAHVKWTLQKKMEEGKLVVSSAPFGYDIIDDQLVINEKEAEYVRYIYERYLDGVGSHTIARELTQMGIKTKRGNSRWNDSTVLDILKNEKYKGELLQGKTCTINPIGKVRKPNKNIAEQYRIEDNHEAIISKEDWAKVQETMDNRCKAYVDGRKRGSTNNTKKYVFSSMIRCGYCGKNYVRRYLHNKKEEVVWQCGTYAKQGKTACSKCRSIKEDEIKGAFVNAVEHMMEESNGIGRLSKRSISKQLADSKNKENKLEKQKSNYQKNIKSLETKIEKLLDLFLEEELDSKTYERKKTELEQRKEKALEGMAKIEEEINSNKESILIIQDINRIKEEEDISDFNADLFKLIIDHVVIGSPEGPEHIIFKFKKEMIDWDIPVFDTKEEAKKDMEDETEDCEWITIKDDDNSSGGSNSGGNMINNGGIHGGKDGFNMASYSGDDMYTFYRNETC